jgi:hypothetical protein
MSKTPFTEQPAQYTSCFRIAGFVLAMVTGQVVAQTNECEALLKSDVFASSQTDSLKIAWFKAFDDEKKSNDFQAFVSSAGVAASDNDKFEHMQQQENYTYDKEDSKSEVSPRFSCASRHLIEAGGVQSSQILHKLTYARQWPSSGQRFTPHAND